MFVQHGLKSGKIFILDKAVLCQNIGCFDAFWGLTLTNFWVFFSHFLSLILQNNIRPYKVDEMTYIVPC